MIFRKTLIMAFLVTAPLWCAEAHPHVFIANRMTVVFDGGVLAGIEFSWTFDQMFTAMILHDFKPGADGSFSPQTGGAIKSNDFDNLENYHYFLAFFVGQQPVKKIRIQQFLPSVADGSRLVYSFFVPLNLQVSAADRTLRVTVYDDSYYVAFDVMHTADVQVQGNDAVAVDLSVEKTKVKPQWPGQYMPDQLVIRYRDRTQ